MSANSRRECLFGVIIFIAGVLYMYATLQLPRKGAVDATFIPKILAALLIGLGALHVAIVYVKNRKKAAAAIPAEKAPPAQAKARPDYRTILVTAALIVAYVALLESVGFLIMSALYLFAQITVLTPKCAKKRHALNAVIAVAVSGFVFYVFRMLLDLMLPLGILRDYTNL